MLFSAKRDIKMAMKNLLKINRKEVIVAHRKALIWLD
jgi:hypothetical protein